MAELICWIILGVASIITLLSIAKSSGDDVEITWGKRRDWERAERKWGK